jgi:hypothetical protein
MQETVCGKSLRAAQTRDGAIVSLVGSRPIRISMRSPSDDEVLILLLILPQLPLPFCDLNLPRRLTAVEIALLWHGSYRFASSSPSSYICMSVQPFQAFSGPCVPRWHFLCTHPSTTKSVH